MSDTPFLFTIEQAPTTPVPPKKASKPKPTDHHPDNLGKAVRLAVPDFSDPNRPLTCLEVDFPIAPINALSNLEGNAGKPVYQMSKWWARRRSSVFRSLLIAAASGSASASASRARTRSMTATHAAMPAVSHRTAPATAGARRRDGLGPASGIALLAGRPERQLERADAPLLTQPAHKAQRVKQHGHSDEGQ